MFLHYNDALINLDNVSHFGIGHIYMAREVWIVYAYSVTKDRNWEVDGFDNYGDAVKCLDGIKNKLLTNGEKVL